jgi:shikimate dehydrogenase
MVLIVNTTPVGMWPQSTTSPWPESICLPESAFVYDLVYNPAETMLVRQARQRGLVVANGLGMLVEQAALAFELWTGMRPDRQAMYQIAMNIMDK